MCITNKSRSKFSPPKDQIADLLTKPLATQTFHHARFNLNARELPLRLRGVSVMYMETYILKIITRTKRLQKTTQSLTPNVLSKLNAWENFKWIIDSYQITACLNLGTCCARLYLQIFCKQNKQCNEKYILFFSIFSNSTQKGLVILWGNLIKRNINACNLRLQVNKNLSDCLNFVNL